MKVDGVLEMGIMSRDEKEERVGFWELGRCHVTPEKVVKCDLLLCII